MNAAAPRRLGPVLMCFEVLCHLQNAVARLVHGRECPVCWERTRHQEAHAYVNHLGEPDA